MTAAESGGATGRLAAIGFATIGRTAFGAALALVVLVRLPAGDSVEVFQLMLLQAVFSTVLSGSAFVRGLADGGSTEAGAAGLRGLALAWAAMAVLLAAADAALIPRELRSAHVTGDSWKLVLLAGGALGVGVQTALQGMLVGRIGPMRTFMPVGATFLAMSAVCVVAPVESAGAALWLVAAAQLLPVAALLATAPEARRLLRRALTARRLPASGAQTRETFVFGAINGGALLTVFALRAWWADTAGPETAERVFFVMRLSDVYMQVAYYGLAMSGRLVRADLHAPAPLARAQAIRVAAVTGAALGLGGVAVWLAVGAAAGLAGWSGVALLVVVQFGIDAVRLPAAALMALAARGRYLARFAALSLVPVAAAALMALALAQIDPGPAMFLYQLAAGGLVVLVWLGLRQRQARA